MNDTLKIDNVISMYIQLRDKKEAIARKMKVKTAEINTAMGGLERIIKEKADRDGVNSFKTAAGTAFLETTSRASVGDWDKVLEFIKQENMYHMLTKGVSKVVVKEYLDNNNSLPPGVNYTTELSVKVRRSSS